MPSLKSVPVRSWSFRININCLGLIKGAHQILASRQIHCHFAARCQVSTAWLKAKWEPAQMPRPSGTLLPPAQPCLPSRRRLTLPRRSWSRRPWPGRCKEFRQGCQILCPPEGQSVTVWKPAWRRLRANRSPYKGPPITIRNHHRQLTLRQQRAQPRTDLVPQGRR